jgi:hypothetical protein
MPMHIHCNKLETVHSRYSNKRQNSNRVNQSSCSYEKIELTLQDPIYGSPKKDN